MPETLPTPKKILLICVSCILIILLLAGCTNVATSSTTTPIPTLLPTSTTIPTPAPRAETILPEAGQLCAASTSYGVDSSLEGKSVEMPVMTLYTDATELAGWQYGPSVKAYNRPYFSPSIEFIEAKSAGEVKTLVCILASPQSTSLNYSDGQPAYYWYWQVWLVGWPDGELIASQYFQGGSPPETKLDNGQPGYGEPPIAEMVGWLMEAVELGDDMIYAGMTPAALAFSPDGNTLHIRGEGSGSLDWDLVNNTARAMDGSSNGSQPVVVSYYLMGPDNTPLVIKVSSDLDSLDSGKASSAKIASGELMVAPGVRATNVHAALSADKRWLAVSLSPDAYYDAPKYLNVLVWDVKSGAIVAKVEGFPPPYDDLAFSPDGRYLLMVSSSGSDLWDTSSWTLVQYFQFTSASAFSPDGKWLALSTTGDPRSESGRIGPALYDLASGEIRLLEGADDHWWRALAFSPDGKRLAVAEAGNFVRLFDVP